MTNEGLQDIGVQIFDYIGDPDLSQARLVCKTWCQFLDTQKFYLQRILKNQKKNPDQWLKSRKDWISLIDKIQSNGDFGSVQKLALLLRDFKVLHKVLQIPHHGSTPFHMAASLENLDALGFFVNHLPNKIPRDHNGRTPLHYAAKTGAIKSIQFLMPLMEEKNPLDKYGWTPLHFAASEGHLEMFQFMTPFLNDKNPKGSIDGETPLHLAIQEGNLKIVEYLINIVPNKNPVRDNGSSALHDAVQNGLIGVVKTMVPLLDDKNPTDND